MNPKEVSKRPLMLTMLIPVILALAGLQSPAGSIVPLHLQCEYRFNPLGIDVAQPRLTWQAQSDERDQRQTAYEIMVSGDKELLQKDHGDLWDSGKIISDE